MKIYEVGVAAENDTIHTYTVLAHSPQQAMNLVKRHHNRTVKHVGYRATDAWVSDSQLLVPTVVSDKAFMK